MPARTRLLTHSQIAGLLPLAECIKAMERAFAAHALGQSLASRLMHVEAPAGEFHVKGGGLEIDGDAAAPQRTVFALKANGGFFGNRARGIPSIRGVILLFDASNGDLLSVMDSREITGLRTAATTAAAIGMLAHPAARTATICGCGGQARRHLLAMRIVRPTIRTIHVWSRDHGRATEFCLAHAAEVGAELLPVADLSVAAPNSEVIITCTPSKRFFLTRAHARPGTFIAAIGADSPDKQEIEPELVAQSRVVVDLVQQCVSAGELHHAIAAGLMTATDIEAELGTLFAGLAPPRFQEGEITLFDSTGTALQDAAAAAMVFDRAAARGVGSLIHFQE